MSWLPKKKIIVPVDFSGVSTVALKTALDMAESPECVHALHIVVPLGNVSPGLSWGAVDDTSRVKDVESHFDEFLAEHDITGVTTVVRIGDPGLQIADYAREVDADLVVITSHGRHGITRFLLGSVAERVIRHAELPVLVLRPEEQPEEPAGS